MFSYFSRGSATGSVGASTDEVETGNESEGQHNGVSGSNDVTTSNHRRSNSRNLATTGTTSSTTDNNAIPTTVVANKGNTTTTLRRSQPQQQNPSQVVQPTQQSSGTQQQQVSSQQPQPQQAQYQQQLQQQQQQKTAMQAQHRQLEQEVKQLETQFQSSNKGTSGSGSNLSRMKALERQIQQLKVASEEDAFFDELDNEDNDDEDDDNHGMQSPSELAEKLASKQRRIDLLVAQQSLLELKHSQMQESNQLLHQICQKQKQQQIPLLQKSVMEYVGKYESSQTQCYQWGVKYSTLQVEHAKREEEYKRKLQHHIQLEQKFYVKEKEWMKIEAEWRDKLKQVAQTANEFKAKEEEWMEHEEEWSERIESLVKKQESTMKAKEEEWTNKEQQWKAREQALLEMNQEHKAKEEEWAKKEQQWKAREQDLLEMNQEHKAKDEEWAEQEEEWTQKIEQIEVEWEQQRKMFEEREQQLLQENEQRTKELEEAQAQLESLEEDNEKISNQNDDLMGEVRELEHNLQETQGSHSETLHKFKHCLEVASYKLAATETSLKEEKEQSATLKQKLEDSEQVVEQLQDEFQRHQEEMSSLQEQLEEERRKSTTLGQKADESDHVVEQLQDEFQELRQTLEMKQEEFQRQNQEWQELLEEKQEELVELETKLEETKESLQSKIASILSNHKLELEFKDSQLDGKENKFMEVERDLLKQLEGKDSQLEEVEQRFLDSQREKMTMERQLLDLQETLEEYQISNEAVSKDFNHLKDKLKGIESLRGDLTLCQTKLESRELELEGYETLKDDLLNKLQSVEDERDELQRQLHAIESSGDSIQQSLLERDATIFELKHKLTEQYKRLDELLKIHSTLEHDHESLRRDLGDVSPLIDSKNERIQELTNDLEKKQHEIDVLTVKQENHTNELSALQRRNVAESKAMEEEHEFALDDLRDRITLLEDKHAQEVSSLKAEIKQLENTTLPKREHERIVDILTTKKISLQSQISKQEQQLSISKKALDEAGRKITQLELELEQEQQESVPTNDHERIVHKLQSQLNQFHLDKEALEERVEKLQNDLKTISDERDNLSEELRLEQQKCLKKKEDIQVLTEKLDALETEHNALELKLGATEAHLKELEDRNHDFDALPLLSSSKVPNGNDSAFARANNNGMTPLSQRIEDEHAKEHMAKLMSNIEQLSDERDDLLEKQAELQNFISEMELSDKSQEEQVSNLTKRLAEVEEELAQYHKVEQEREAAEKEAAQQPPRAMTISVPRSNSLHSSSNSQILARRGSGISSITGFKDDLSLTYSNAMTDLQFDLGKLGNLPEEREFSESVVSSTSGGPFPGLEKEKVSQTRDATVETTDKDQTNALESVQKLDEVQKALELSQGQVKTLEELVKNLQQQLTQIKAYEERDIESQKQLKDMEQTHSKTIADLTTQLQSAQTELSRSQEQSRTLEVTVNELQNQVTQSKLELERVQERQLERQAMQNDANSSVVSTLTKQLETSQTTIVSLRTQVEQQSKDLESSKDTVTALRNSIKDAESRLETIIDERDDYQMKLRHIERDLERTKEQCESWEQQIVKMTRSKDTSALFANREIDRLKHEVKQLTALKEEQEDKLKEFQLQVENSEKLTADLTCKIEQQKVEWDATQKEKEHAWEEEKREAQKASQKEIASKDASVQRLEKELSAIKAKLEMSTATKTSLQTYVSTLVLDLKTKESELSQLKYELKVATTKKGMTNNSTKTDESEGDATTVANKAESLEERRDAIENLRQTLKTKQKEIDQLNGTIEENQREIKQLKKNLSSKQATIKSLNAKLEQQKEEQCEVEDDLAKQMEETSLLKSSVEHLRQQLSQQQEQAKTQQDELIETKRHCGQLEATVANMEWERKQAEENNMHAVLQQNIPSTSVGSSGTGNMSRPIPLVRATTAPTTPSSKTTASTFSRRSMLVGGAELSPSSGPDQPDALPIKNPLIPINPAFRKNLGIVSTSGVVGSGGIAGRGDGSGALVPPIEAPDMMSRSSSHGTHYNNNASHEDKLAALRRNWQNIKKEKVIGGNNENINDAGNVSRSGGISDQSSSLIGRRPPVGAPKVIEVNTSEAHNRATFVEDDDYSIAKSRRHRRDYSYLRMVSPDK